jgi:hypothetical protein
MKWVCLAGAVLCSGLCRAQMSASIPGSIPPGYTAYSAMVERNEIAARAQAAMQAAQQARLNAMRARVSAMMQGAAMTSQQAGDQSASGAPAPVLPPFRPTSSLLTKVDKPSFSVPAGKVSAGTKVKLSTDTHYSTLYYTTDGWTPTSQSARYTGPLTIHDSTHLQVVAIGPNMMRSPISRIDYTVEGPAPVLAPPVQVKDGTLRAGTPLRLAIGGKEISSADASVGDKVTVVLEQEIKDGEEVLAPKGTEVTAVLTNADKMGSGGPGDLVFEVQSMTIHGKEVPLVGSETMEGQDGVLSKKDAVITPGMTLTVVVGADVQVKP